MPDRVVFRLIRLRRHWPLLRIVALVLTVLVSPKLAWAARVPAPMCTPDARSMAAPLQQMPTSAAEITRPMPCVSVHGNGWKLLPQYPNQPPSWNESVADPLWLSCVDLKASAADLVRWVSPVSWEHSARPGYAGEIYRPPIGPLD
jgi:hypothetical protein